MSRSPYGCRRALLACAVGLTPAWALAQQPDAPSANAGVRYYSTSWDFNDVDVATLVRRLARIRLKLPVELSGKISGSLRVGVPWNALATGRAWRFGGTLTSPQLAVNGFVIQDVHVRLEFRDGDLRLEQLSIHIPALAADPAQPVGALTGAAQMQLLPRGRLTASAELKQFPLQSLGQAFTSLRDASGRLSGALTASAPVDQLRDPAAWKIDGPVTLQDFAFRGAPPADAAVQLALSGGVLSAKQFTLNVGAAQLTSSATLDLRGRQPWRVAAALNAPSVKEVVDLVGRFVPGDLLATVSQQLTAGAAQATVDLAGDLNPFISRRLAGHAELTSLVWQPPAELRDRVPLRPIVIDHAAFDYNLSDQNLHLTRIVAAVAAGQATGALTIPLGDRPALANLQWNGVQPARILAEPFGGEGASSGTLALTIPAGATTDLLRWEAQVNATLSELSFRDWTVTNLQTGAISLSGGRLQIPGFNAQLDGQPMTLSLDLLLGGAKTFTSTFNLPRIDLGWLRSIPQLAEHLATLEGAAAVSGQASGVWQPLRISGGGSVVANRVRYQGRIVDALRFNVAAVPDQVTLSDIQASLYGGRLTGSTTVKIGEQLGVAARIAGNNISAPPLLANIDLGPLAIAGPISGTLNLDIPAGALERPELWSAQARLAPQAVDAYAWQFRQIQPIDLTLSHGRLAAPAVRAVVDGGPIEAAVTLQIHDAWALDVRGQASGARLDRIAALPPLASLQGRLGGRLGFTARLQGTLNPLQLSAAGRAAALNVRFDSYQVDRATFDYDYRPDSLSLSQIEATLYGGHFAGDVTVPLADGAAGVADLAFRDIDSAAVSRLLGPQPVQAAGPAAGRMKLQIPAGASRTPAKWTGEATLDLDRLNVYSWRLTDIRPLDVVLADGRVSSPAIQATLDGQPFDAALHAGLEAPYAVDGRLALRQLSLARLASVPQLDWLAGRLGGTADLTSAFQGTLEPLKLTAHGAVSAQSLRWDRHLIDQLRLSFDLSPQSLALSGIEAVAFDGRITGDATIPLGDATPGAASLNWRDVAVDRLLAGFASSPNDLQGLTRGRVNLQIPAGAQGQFGRWDFTLDAALPELRSNGVIVAALQASASQRQGQLAYQAAGRLFDGALQLNGERPANAAALTGPAALGTARLTLQDASLERIASAAAGALNPPAPISGRFALQLQTQAGDAPQAWSWTADARLGAVNFAGSRLTNGVTLLLQGDARSARLANLSGQLVGGALSGSGDWQIAPRRAGAFRISLRQADLQQLAGLAAPRDEPPFSGPVDIELLVRPGLAWRIVGTAASPRARAAGLVFRNVRVPIDLAWHPAAARVSLQLSGVNLAVAGGRITGRLSAVHSYGWTIDGDFRFYRVDFTSLTGSTYGRGTLTGTLDLGGRNVRSVNDLSATLLARLDDAQATSIPVISQIAVVVPGLASSASTFSDGNLQARLHRGVIRVEELSLASSQLQLYVSGQATLAGALQLQAVVSTGDRIESLLARNLLARLAVHAVAPVTLLLEANDFLSNRVVHLAIGGTFSRPSIRILPFQTLREEVVRFFLRQAAGAVIPGAAGIGTAAGSSRR
ncbi:MAG: hypothetical protein IT424_04170 [Pirellulales bacterium]|nr:hypothetical protein [Pirellulales bacterium]